MQLSKLTDDRGVSPVIGVILMVAITVILAAVIAVFALGFTDTPGNDAPQVTFQTEFTNDTDSNGNGVVEITVTSGDSFDPTAVTFEGTLVDSAEPDGTTTKVESEGEDWTESDDVSGEDDSVSAGDTITLGVPGPGYDVDLIYLADSGDDSSIIRTLEGPDA